MCVAILKPKNVALPSNEILENCFHANPDGAGFCFPIKKGKKSMLHIVKGIMTWEEFLCKIEELKTQIDTTQNPMLLHFRIGTHGSKADPSHTHPFPVVDNYEDMCRLEFDTKWAAVHNGIFQYTGGDKSSYRPYGLWNKKTQTYEPLKPSDNPSDTMEFVKNLIYPLVIQKDFYNNKPLLNLVNTLVSNNKFILMNENGISLRFGEFIRHEGVFYSNKSYAQAAPKNRYIQKPKKHFVETQNILIPNIPYKSSIRSTLVSNMKEFLSDENRSLILLYDEKIETFEEALKACDLKPLWSLDAKQNYDRLYAETLKYDAAFEPDSGIDSPELLPEPTELYYTSDMLLGIQNVGNYLLYKNLYLWNKHDHSFEFYATVYLSKFVAGYEEYINNSMKFKVTKQKSYLDELYPITKISAKNPVSHENNRWNDDWD